MFSNKNMKQIVLWIFGIMIISFLAAGSMVKTNSFSKSKGKQVDVNKTFAASEIKDIVVNTVSTDIRILPTDGGDSNEIKMHYYGEVAESNNNPATEITSEVNGSTLNIKEKHKFYMVSFGFMLNRQELKLDIYVPKAYMGDMDVNTVSGSLELSGINLNDLDAGSTSGDLRMEGVATKQTDFHTTSGKMNAENFAGDIKFNSVSGDLDIKYIKFDNNVKVNTTSGSAKLELPEDSQFGINFNSVSGSLENDFPMMQSNSSGRHSISGTVGNSNKTIEIKSVSGSGSIRKF